jgi:hypothetical protein
VELFKRNVKLHSRKWEKAGDPTPVIIQGDSREFAKLVGECSAIVTSPPYAETHVGGDIRVNNAARGTGKDLCNACGANYADTPGQIGALKAGNVDAVITSPPYADSVKGEHGETETAKDSRDKRQTEGGSLGQSHAQCSDFHPPKDKHRRMADSEYGKTDGQLGNTKGESYWQAMQIVYDQCRLVLKPGGVLCVVVKDYIKDGKRVPLCDQTLALLEHVGFIPVERIRAMLVKEDRHPGLFGDDVVERKERKSFFRRLAEKKGSPRIDWEEVLVARKDAAYDEVATAGA